MGVLRASEPSSRRTITPAAPYCQHSRAEEQEKMASIRMARKELYYEPRMVDKK
ncbi:Uncharacterized protein DAT39_016929 [Clarias magur]|uniref:Uncharacterized protein n=1 Tax=Clarias magur TaxID=1594786 RepID=A0A8J4TB63_CLAMG|nr:Uncharacterized protein DAT39_016929 [Clarias magur]